jgi:hypothetical protein
MPKLDHPLSASITSTQTHKIHLPTHKDKSMGSSFVERYTAVWVLYIMPLPLLRSLPFYPRYLVLNLNSQGSAEYSKLPLYFTSFLSCLCLSDTYLKLSL